MNVLGGHALLHPTLPMPMAVCIMNKAYRIPIGLQYFKFKHFHIESIVKFFKLHLHNDKLCKILL